MTRFLPAGKRLAVATITAVLATLLTVAVQPDAAGAYTTGAGAATSAPPAPCPKTAVPGVSGPPRPSPPPGDPVHRVVGGDRLATSGLAVPPAAARPPAVTAASWLVADLDTGAVLGTCGPHEYATPASVQKLLLVATMLPRLDPRQIVTVSRADLRIEPGSSAVGLVQGGRYSVKALWLGLLLASGNDAANVLARLGGGKAGVEGGVQEMNAQAARLGAFQTHAVTPSGLDAPGQFTSAYDLALIARACFADRTFRRYTLTRWTQIPAQPPKHIKGFQIQNQNQLIDDYPGALGGKTGFTDLARHTYVGAAERHGRRLVVTLLGAEHLPLRGWQQGAALLDWGFAQPPDASVGRLVEPGEAVASPSSSLAGSAAATAPSTAANALINAGWAGTPPILALGAAVTAVCVVLSAAALRRRGYRRRSRT